MSDVIEPVQESIPNGDSAGSDEPVEAPDDATHQESAQQPPAAETPVKSPSQADIASASPAAEDPKLTKFKQAAKSKITQLSQQLTETKDALQKEQESTASLKEQLAELQKSVEEAKGSGVDASEVEALKERVEELEAQAKKEQQLKQQQQQRDQSRAAFITSLEERNTAQKERIAELEADLAERPEASDAEESKKRVAELEKQLSDLEGKVSQLNEKNTEAAAQNDRLLSEKQNLEETVASARVAQERAEEQLKAAAAASEEVKRLQQEKASVESSLEEMKQKLENLQAQEQDEVEQRKQEHERVTELEKQLKEITESKMKESMAVGASNTSTNPPGGPADSTIIASASTVAAISKSASKQENMDASELDELPEDEDHEKALAKGKTVTPNIKSGPVKSRSRKSLSTMGSIQAEKDALQGQVDSLTAELNKQKSTYQRQIAEKDSKIDLLQKQVKKSERALKKAAAAANGEGKDNEKKEQEPGADATEEETTGEANAEEKQLSPEEVKALQDKVKGLEDRAAKDRITHAKTKQKLAKAEERIKELEKEADGLATLAGRRGVKVNRQRSMSADMTAAAARKAKPPPPPPPKEEEKKEKRAASATSARRKPTPEEERVAREKADEAKKRLAERRKAREARESKKAEREAKLKEKRSAEAAAKRRMSLTETVNAVAKGASKRSSSMSRPRSSPSKVANQKLDWSNAERKPLYASPKKGDKAETPGEESKSRIASTLRSSPSKVGSLEKSAEEIKTEVEKWKSENEKELRGIPLEHVKGKLFKFGTVRATAVFQNNQVFLRTAADGQILIGEFVLKHMKDQLYRQSEAKRKEEQEAKRAARREERKDKDKGEGKEANADAAAAGDANGTGADTKAEETPQEPQEPPVDALDAEVQKWVSAHKNELFGVPLVRTKDTPDMYTFNSISAQARLTVGRLYLHVGTAQYEIGDFAREFAKSEMYKMKEDERKAQQQRKKQERAAKGGSAGPAKPKVDEVQAAVKQWLADDANKKKLRGVELECVKGTSYKFGSMSFHLRVVHGQLAVVLKGNSSEPFLDDFLKDNALSEMRAMKDKEQKAKTATEVALRKKRMSLEPKKKSSEDLAAKPEEKPLPPPKPSVPRFGARPASASPSKTDKPAKAKKPTPPAKAPTARPVAPAKATASASSKPASRTSIGARKSVGSASGSANNTPTGKPGSSAPVAIRGGTRRRKDGSSAGVASSSSSNSTNALTEMADAIAGLGAGKEPVPDAAVDDGAATPVAGSAADLKFVAETVAVAEEAVEEQFDNELQDEPQDAEDTQDTELLEDQEPSGADEASTPPADDNESF